MLKFIIKIINGAKSFWNTRSYLEKNIIVGSIGCMIFHRQIGNFMQNKEVYKSFKKIVKFAGSTLASYYIKKMFGKNSESNNNENNNNTKENNNNNTKENNNPICEQISYP